MHNNLFLNRLLIYTNEGLVAYDEIFHKGVNIIRGDNSSGKSTITHFIFFVLGASFNDFVPEARKCQSVFAEVEMNGAVFTIKRNIEISEKTQKINSSIALNIYWGNLDESLNPPKDKYWQKFEFNTSPNKKSFSNVLFENLDIPIVKGENNITFHQILRLLYIDQDSPTSSLFYFEQFDSQITRETVSDLLLGVYNQDLYDSKRRLDVAQKELDNTKSEIKITKQFFSDDFALNTEHLKTTIENKQKEIFQIEERILEIRNKKIEIEYNEKSKLEFQTLSEQSIGQREKVLSLEETIENLNFEIEDSTYFIETLNEKVRALKNSIQTRGFLGTFPLEYCPECLTKINEVENHSTCKLCKETIDGGFGIVQARRMEQEISFQINESTILLERNKRILMEVSTKYESELIRLQQLQNQVNTSLKDVKSFNEEELDKLYTAKGFIDGEILQFRTLLEQAELYEKLLEKKAELDKEISKIESYIYITNLQQQKLKKSIIEQIKIEGTYLLNKDSLGQSEFKNANDFHIDFSNNLVYLNSKNSELAKEYHKFSASSNFYLKVSGRFALFLASLSIEGMRYPRFIFADNMEDKGIQIDRARNFQQILIDRVSEFDTNSYQMIYTTSFISDELRDSPYCVGEFYTEANPSLKNIKK
ncbi:Rad50/SbcC-type AAA domain containing protein [Spirosomataceae bacterium]